jgi:DNA-binding GntR family transcriptional regulator
VSVDQPQKSPVESRATRPSLDSRLGNMGRPRTATAYVAEYLRRSILNGELAGGTRLSLVEIASTFEVSTTPVREPLRQLAFEGLVRLDSYRGGLVTEVTRAEAEEIVRIRQVLEPMAIEEVVVGITPTILGEAQGILDDMAAADTWDRWIHGNLAFHRKIYESAASPRLVALIKNLQDTTVVFVSATLRRSPGLRETATEEHARMLQAARDGDADTLTRLTLRHLTLPVRD